jgi:hypothetical protein
MITAQAVTVDKNDAPYCRYQLPTFLTATEIRMPASWHYLAFSKIHDIENAGELHEGVGDLRIQPATAAYARTVLDSLYENLKSELLPTPGISPLSGGGIGIVWTAGTKEVEAVIYPDATASFLALRSDIVESEAEFVGNRVEPLSDALRQMLQG